jgi:AcrR family transcriptional regulator
MNVGSVVRPRLVEAAIELFGAKGYDGVAIADLASAANTTGATVYRLFQHKKSKVYSVAVREAVYRAHQAVEECKFLLEDATGDVGVRIGFVLQFWYQAFGKKEARLLQQVLMADSKNRKLAREALHKMADRLAKALEMGAKRKDPELLREIARAVIDGLFQIKVSGDESENWVRSRINAFVELLFR